MVSKYATEEERKAAAREAQRRYRNSEKGRKTCQELEKKYRATEHGRNNRVEANRRYMKTDKYRKVKDRYLASEKGQEAMIRWREKAKQKLRAVAPAIPFRTKLLTNDLYEAANAATPRYLPDHIRDDIISDLVVGVLAGEFTIDEIPIKARKVITENRKHTGKWGNISLDAPTFHDSSRTLHDTVSEGLW